jgi:AcrR family transcriptional regulator
MSAVAAALKPRKSPVQTRSALTVEALHAATIQVLIREGLARCTTTRIAERAGTSVGSLYQYYPNRDGLLRAVLAQHLEGIAAAVERACREHEGRPVGEMASALVTGFLAAKLRDPDGARALYAASAERGGAMLAARMRERVVAAVADMLATAPDARFDDPALVAGVAFAAMVGPVHILLEGNAQSGPGSRLPQELILLVTAYFQAYRMEFLPTGKQAAPARLSRRRAPAAHHEQHRARR